MHVGVTLEPARGQHVRVPADHGGGAGVDDLVGQFGGVRERTVRTFQPPVQEDDDVVVFGCGIRDRIQQPVLHLVLGGGQAGLVLARGPRGDELFVQYVRGAEQGDALAVDLGDVRGVGLVGVVAGAHEGDRGVVTVVQGVEESVLPVVHAVVVGDGGHVHTRQVQRLQGGRRGAEDIVLVGDGCAALGDGGLQVDHGQVGGGEAFGDRVEGGRGVVEPGQEQALEHHVATEGDGEGLGRLLGGRLGFVGAFPGGYGTLVGRGVLVCRGTGGGEGERQGRGADREDPELVWTWVFEVHRMLQYGGSVGMSAEMKDVRPPDPIGRHGWMVLGFPAVVLDGNDS